MDFAPETPRLPLKIALDTPFYVQIEPETSFEFRFRWNPCYPQNLLCIGTCSLLKIFLGAGLNLLKVGKHPLLTRERAVGQELL